MAKSSTTPSPRKRTTRKPNGGAVDPNGAHPPDADFNGAHAGEISEDDIRIRAYHLYLERGRGDGADFDDWVEAERELKSPRHN